MKTAALSTSSRSISVFFWVAALGWLALGLTLSFVAPAFSQVFAALYTDWDTSPYIRIRAFRWPSYVWAVASVVPASLVLYVGRALRGKHSLAAQVGCLASLGVVFVVSVDWLTGFISCHELGCKRLINLW
jgi:hypothetical protein